MKHILTALLFFPVLIFAADESNSDEDFAENYIVQFELGMSVVEVHDLLLKQKDKVEFFNNCIEEAQYPVTDCEKGYSLITTIKLPGDESVDRGDLQLYFTFNNKQQLVDNFYEIYYTEQH